MGLFKYGVTAVATVAAAGAGIGYAHETHVNDVAKGRVITIDTCLKTVPHETAINKALKECFENGVPGGNKTGPRFKEDQPLAFVEAFRTHEQQEGKAIEAGRIAVDAVIAPVVVAGAIWLFAD